MTEVAVSGLMALLTVVQIITMRHRRSQRILYSSALITLAMFLNVDEVYLAVDQMLGGRNHATFLSDVALITGTYFLSAAAIVSVRGTEDRRVRSPVWLLIVAACVMVVTFAFIDTTHSSTRFMIDFGDQPAAAAYNSVQFVYLGVVLGYTGAVILRNRSRLTARASSIGFTIFAVGCVVGIGLVVDVIGMNVSHLMGRMGLLHFLQGLYSPMFFGVMALLCTGLAIPAAARFVLRLKRDRRTAALIRQLEPLWTRVVSGSAIRTAISDDDHEMQLHRMVVEIEDARFRSGGVLHLSDDESLRLRLAHDHIAIPRDLVQIAPR